MKIAQVSPLYESVPPALYGGTERIVSYLTEALVSQGHDVTLFASGDSRTKAELVSPCPRSIRLDPKCLDPIAYHIMMLELVFRRAADFDAIHYHIDYLHFPFSMRNGLPHLTTLHGRLDLDFLPSLHRLFQGMPLVSISDSQREPLPFASWLATIYHGIPIDLYPWTESHESYLAFVGRISPEKGVDAAIEIAKRTGIPLKIAAKVDPLDVEYYKRVKPLFDHPLVEYVGEISDAEKGAFLGGAQALLFPIDWPEPFGLAMIEAMACGTPVIARRRGSVPEVVDHGTTGLIVETTEEAIQAVETAAGMSRRACRERFEERFTATRMAEDYVKVYEGVAARHYRSARVA